MAVYEQGHVDMREGSRATRHACPSRRRTPWRWLGSSVFVRRRATTPETFTRSGTCLEDKIRSGDWIGCSFKLEKQRRRANGAKRVVQTQTNGSFSTCARSYRIIISSRRRGCSCGSRGRHMVAVLQRISRRVLDKPFLEAEQG
jgi:hypothetical protein